MDAQDRARSRAATSAWLALRRRRKLLLPLGLCSALILTAIIGPMVAPYPPDASVGSTLSGPSAAHWFGTDELGRDTFSRMLAGTRVSIAVGVGSVVIGLVLGSLIGILAGLRAHTWVENALMRLMDLLLALPVLVVASVLAGLTGGSGIDLGPLHVSNVLVVLVIIALVAVPIFARLARASTLAEAKEEYILAARISGLKERRIIWSELLPNVIDPLIVQGALSVGAAIAAEAALSFLGLGIQPPQASWGNILQDGEQQLLLGAWWLVVFPTAAIALSTLSFVLLGDRLRDHLDPRTIRGGELEPTVAIAGAGQTAEPLGVPGASPAVALGSVEEQERPAASRSIPEAAGWTPSAPLLEIDDLTVRYSTGVDDVLALRNISFWLRIGEVLGIVGETGSGKSTVLRAVMRLLSANAAITSGSIRFQTRNLLTLDESEIARVRGSQIAMVFQDPVNFLNPSFTVGSQLERVFRLHRPDVPADERAQRALEILSRVGIDGHDKLGSYSFELSQGQMQRVALAAACLGSKILLLLADEPTTSLDVTIEAQVMSILEELQRELDLSVLLVSHDIALVSQHSDRILVMYAGRIVEEGRTRDVIDHPQHPYTVELLRAVPELADTSERLYTMRGELRSVGSVGKGCPFAPRCPRRIGPICDEEEPILRSVDLRRVACHAVDRSVHERAAAAAAGGPRRSATNPDQP